MSCFHECGGARSMSCFHECGVNGSGLPFCSGTALTRYRGTAHSRYDLNKTRRVLESGYLSRRFVAQQLGVKWFDVRSVELTASPKGASRTTVKIIYKVSRAIV